MGKLKWLIPLLSVALVIALSSLNFNGNPLFVFKVRGADAQGNDIVSVAILQFANDTLIANFTATGGTCRVTPSYQVNFEVQVKMNSSLCNVTTILTYTRCNLTITNQNGTNADGFTNLAMTNNGAQYTATTYYYTWFTANWTTDLPRIGEYYNCTVTYQAYY